MERAERYIVVEFAPGIFETTSMRTGQKNIVYLQWFNEDGDIDSESPDLPELPIRHPDELIQWCSCGDPRDNAYPCHHVLACLSEYHPIPSYPARSRMRSFGMQWEHHLTTFPILMALKEELRAKNSRIEGLEDKVQRMEKYTRDLENQLLRKGITPHAKAKPYRSSKQADSLPTPNYLRPTKASNARYKQQSSEDTTLISPPAATPPLPEISRPFTTFENNAVVTSGYQLWGEMTIDYLGLRWDDSELLEFADETHHYQNSTSSSMAKKRYPVFGSYSRRFKDAGKDSWGDTTLISSEPHREPGASNRHLESSNDNSDSESIPELAEDVEKRELPTKLEDCITYEELAELCGLTDTTFRDTSASQCHISTYDKLTILEKALSLSQKAIWQYSKRTWQGTKHRFWPETPKEVEFGRDAMMRVFFIDNSTDPLIRAVFAIVELRNRVAHPANGSNAPNYIDKYVLSALELAVRAEEYGVIRELQELRQMLFSEAQKSLEFIEQFSLLAMLPFAEPWPIHLHALLHDTQYHVRTKASREYNTGLDLLPENFKRVAYEYFSNGT